MAPLFHLGLKKGSRTHLKAGVRWTPAATSSKTGCFLYFYSPLRRIKVQIDSRILLQIKRGADGTSFLDYCYTIARI